MKKLTLTLFIALIAIAISSCKKDSTNNTINPEACFNLSTTTIGIGEYFTCTSCSKNAETIEWSVNNVQVSAGTDLYYNLDSTGTYTIKLTAISKDGKTNSITKTITVTNQYLKYAGNWRINEEGYIYNSILSFDNKGNASFTKYSEYEVPAKLNKTTNSSPEYNYIDNYIVDLTDNIIINSRIEFSDNGTQKQFTGYTRYYQGSNYLSESDISAVKQ